LSKREIIVRERQSVIIVRSPEHVSTVRNPLGIRLIEIARQGPPGSGTTNPWFKEEFTIENNGDREFSLVNTPLLNTVFPSLNGLIQVGFSIVDQTLTLDNDVETVAGDVLSVHYQSM